MSSWSSDGSRRLRFPGRYRLSPSQWLPSDPGRLHLVVAGHGARLGKRSERLVVREGTRVTAEIPFADLEQVTIAGPGVTISADAIYHLSEHGIPVTFITTTGRPVARLSSPNLTATVVTRRAQLAAADDDRGAAAAVAFVTGKLRNQAVVLKYFAKTRRHTYPSLHERLVQTAQEITGQVDSLGSLQGKHVDEIREQLLLIEARAARLYWDAVQALLPERLGFPGRRHQDASDPVNVMLNYGYGVLYNEAWGALLFAGLEPFAGFIHVDRSGKPSLVLDFVEEFRQAVVDRPIFGEVLRGYVPKLEDGMLSLSDRRRIVEAIFDRLESHEDYRGKRHRLRTIIHLQARRLAMMLRREGTYEPFVAGW